MSQFAVDGYAIVTGGAGGIGREIGLTFAEAGAHGVLFCDIDLEAASLVAQESRKIATHPDYTAFAVQIDVTNTESVQRMVEFAIGKYPRIDYCINAAGVDVAEYVPFTECPVSEYERVMGVNAKGAFLVSQAVTKVMQAQEPITKTIPRAGSRDLGRGSIVNVASAMSHGGVPAKLPYMTSKHALLGITRSCAMDCRALNIRVNQVAPTWVRTPMYEEECKKVPATPQIVEAIMPTKRVAEPHEVAAAVLYLCGPSAAYINGHSLLLDASLSVGPAVIGG